MHGIPSATGWIRRILNEPMMHFLIIGGLVFLLYAWSDSGATVGGNHRIIINDALVSDLKFEWSKKWGRPPTQSQTEHLIQQYIKDEVRYRQARRMGLYKNDATVRNRLIKKLIFITEDLGVDLSPTKKEIAQFFESHTEDFRVPAQFSFRQVFFSTDHRPDARADAKALLVAYQQTDSGRASRKSGDLFLGRKTFTNAPADRVEEVFGKDFVQALKDAPVDQWAGPIRSVYGFHLVYVEQHRKPYLPTLAQVYDEVLFAYQETQRQLANQRVYKMMRKKYTVADLRDGSARPE